MRALGFALVVLLLVPIAATAQNQPPARRIRIIMEEYRFSPSTIAIKAGEPIRLELQNAGQREHQFRSRIFRGIDVWVRTTGFDTRSERMEVIVVRPRWVATIEFVRKKPGEYEFWCSESTNGQRHRDMGMVGKFVVAP